ncbi:MAG TPA: HdeD family acid-resistance protein [Candidatus Sulfotelmatobacter sp.]|nr:HdeD family acid-resistance protein [Candidatus Sulfotelmatobacter sp.]
MTPTPLIHEQELRHAWGWFLALGLISVLLGIIALFMVPIATVAAVLFLGWLMIAGGVIEAIHAFRVRGWRGGSLHLIAGILGILIGSLIVGHPVAGALAWTLLFASFFTVIGAFRIITALRLRFHHWEWTVLDGVVTLILGIIVAFAWPWSGFWFLGLALGISLLLRGWSYIVFSWSMRSITPAREVPEEIRKAA